MCQITVYYRGVGEHLNPTDPSTENRSFFSAVRNEDFGHAFLRVDYQGQATYLDGWPTTPAEPDGQPGAFYWNTTETQDRLDDHHDITWATSPEEAQQAIQLIDGIKNSTTPYDGFNFNCADMTLSVLNDLGYSFSTQTTYVPGIGNVSLPGDMGSVVTQGLTTAGTPYQQDVTYPVKDKDAGKETTDKDGAKDAGDKENVKDAGDKEADKEGAKDAGDKDGAKDAGDKDAGKDAGDKDGGKDTGDKDSKEGKDAGDKDSKEAGDKDGKDASDKDGGKDDTKEGGGDKTNDKDGGKEGEKDDVSDTPIDVIPHRPVTELVAHSAVQPFLTDEDRVDILARLRAAEVTISSLAAAVQAEINAISALIRSARPVAYPATHVPQASASAPSKSGKENKESSKDAKEVKEITKDESKDGLSDAP